MPAATTTSSLNFVVLRGECSAAPEPRTLESGSRLTSLALRVHTSGDGPRTSVPITWWDPPAWADALEAGDELVVMGVVRRRFFRVGGGGAGAKVEVEAQHVARASDRRRVATLVRRATRVIETIEP